MSHNIQLIMGLLMGRLGQKIAGIGVVILALGGCTNYHSDMPPPKAGHIKPPPQVVGTIPAPVTHSHQPVVPTDDFSDSSSEDLYTISVADFSVRGLLYSLAKNADLNVDISPEITGIVTLNVIEQTLPRVLERIAQMVNLRFEVDGPTLVVKPDTQYIHTYEIDYLNIDRKMTSNLRLTSQIASASGGITTTDSSVGAGGNSNSGRSNINVDNFSENNFWSVLEANVRAILGDSAEKQKSTQQQNSLDPLSVSGAEALPLAGEQFVAGGQVSQLIPTAAPEEKNASSLVIINQQSGLVSVRATYRQHAEVQLFLDKLMAGARRQVRIEASILEVRLDKSHEAGIDWTAFRDVGSNRQTNYNVVGSNTSTTLATVVAREAPLVTMNMSDPAAGVANISAVFHNVNAAVKLLDRFGDVRVLSSPKLVTLNNQLAVLKVVDNLVYFTVDKNERESNSTLITTYTSNVRTVPVGLVMSVLPQISPNEQVSLIVRPTITRVVDFVTDPNPDLATSQVISRIPQIQVLEMESMLSVQSGQTAVIGGLMTSVINDVKGSVPGLSKSSLFGGLFKHRKESVTNVELVIFMKPTVIRSDVDLMEPQDLKLLNSFFNNRRILRKKRTIVIGQDS